jgi:AcrR family transcriptional regulator
MVGDNSSPARQRLVDAAARLFAARGFAATSVADIQQACGLTGGSGALYKHFPSKRALLDEVVGVHLATMRAGHVAFAEQVPDDVEDALGYIVDSVWTRMRSDRAVLRVLLRDLDDFPELLERVWAEIRTNVYDVLTTWITKETERGTMRVDDPAATAAVLLSSLTYLPILHALIGHTPGDVDAERFGKAWVQHALATLTP